jgi:hypothetical protein
VEAWQIVASLGLLVGHFGFVHYRMYQVRQEAIDIADRNSEHLKDLALENQKDVRQIADYLREDFVSRAADLKATAIDLKAAHEQLRREAREDQKSIAENNERFRQEMRQTLHEILREVRTGNGKSTY